MHTSLFFKLFPPPNFLLMPYIGLEISDDAFCALQYSQGHRGRIISKYAYQELPAGLMDGGDIKDKKAFAETLKAFAKEHGISRAKVSIPEEKAYLFQVEVPSGSPQAIAQSIEFKLEENVPLSPADAVFYFDILSLPAVAAGHVRVSVSVVPRSYIEHVLSVLAEASIHCTGFEVVPRSVARAILPHDGTHLIIHVMKKKAGIYIVSGDAVYFSSTIVWGEAGSSQVSVDMLSKEIDRVYSYWTTRPGMPAINQMLVAGRDAVAIESALRSYGATLAHIPTSVGNVWQNSLEINAYVPPISLDDSFHYAVAAGLALYV